MEISNQLNEQSIEQLKENAKLLEYFCMLPNKHKGEQTILCLQLLERWSGWKLKDELVRSLKLVPGETISNVVRSFYATGLSSDTERVDLFMSGDAAQWVISKELSAGDIFTGEVKFCYESAPVGPGDKQIEKASLILLRGIDVIEHKANIPREETADLFLQRFLAGLQES